MAISISASSSQSQNAAANQSTVYGSGSMTLTVGSWSGLQQYGIVYIGGAEYWSAGYTSMSQGGSWGWSASRTYDHDYNSGYRGDVGVSVYHFVDGTSYHQGSASAATQGAIDYNRSANTPYYNNITRTSSTNIYVTYARTGSVNGPTTYVLERATSADMSANYTTVSEGNQTVDSTTSYYYRMYAYGTEGGNKYSGVYGPYYGVPTAPTSVVGTASGSVSGRITVSWTAPSVTNGGITNYQVYRGGSYIGQTGNASTSYIDDGLTKGTSYSYTVVAVNAAGSSVASSASTSTQAPGVPYAPTLSSATASTDTFGKVSLSWTAPSTAVGTIQNYYMYAVYNSVIEKTVATASATTSGVITGLDERKVYTFYVRARNQFSIDNGTPGDQSNTINRKSPGPPTAPLNLTSTAPFSPPGTVDLSWTAPTDVGTEGGTITGYSVYLAGGSTPIKNTTGTGTSTTIEDLIPATSYTFNVRARNEIADIVGTFSVASNSTTATAQGEPEAPTNLTVVSDPLVAGRLILTWTPPVGYNTGFRVYTGADVLVANIAVPRLEIDGLTPNTSYSYKVRARNPLTDLTGSPGGPASSTVSGTVGSSSTQTVPSISVSNSTNNALVGTFNLIGTTATTMSYSRVASNIPFASVPSSGGTTTNNTNVNLNNSGTPYVISVVGTQSTSTAITFSRAGSDIAANTSTPSGTMQNNTNAIFNGSYEVLASPAPDSVAKTVSYTKVHSNISSRAASGPVTNNSNAVYNGEYVVSDVTETTISYEKSNDDIEESAAFGIVYNKTNHDIFNGTFTLTDTPDYRTVEYSTGDLIYAENLITNPSFETVQSGSTVLRTNLITNPSFETNVTGWAGTNASIARSADQAKYGTHSALVSPSSNTGSVGFAVTLPASDVYTFSAWVYCSENKNLKITGGSTIAVTEDTWTRLSYTTGTLSGAQTFSIESVDSSAPFYVDGVMLESSSLLRPYFDGASTDELGWDYGWSGTAHASTSTAKAFVPAPRTNLVTNPSFQNLSNPAVNWGGQSANLSVTALSAVVGSYSLGVLPGTNTGGAVTSLGTIPTSTDDLICSAYVYAYGLAKNIKMYVSVTGGGTANGDTVYAPANTWTRISVTVPASMANVVGGNPTIYIVGTDSTAAFLVDAVLAERATGVNSYFDGSFAGATWSGTAHESTSSLAVTQPLPVGVSGSSADIVCSYAQAHSGSLSALVTPAASTGGAAITMTTVADTVYTFSAWVYATSAKNMKLSADATVGTTVAVPATTWTRLSLSFTAADTSTILSVLGTDSTTSFYLDDVMLIESLSDSDYFDGDTDATASTWPAVYTWSGTAHASTSIREVGGTLPEVGAELIMPYGQAARVNSKAQLQIQYRSGWIG